MAINEMKNMAKIVEFGVKITRNNSKIFQQVQNTSKTEQSEIWLQVQTVVKDLTDQMNPSIF